MKNIQISYWDGVKSSGTPKTMLLSEVFNEIQEGKYFTVVDTAREEYDFNGKTDRYKDIKGQLPIFQLGKFTGRNDKDIKEHPNMIGLDLDVDEKKGVTSEDIERFIEESKNDPYIYAQMRSVSGQGLYIMVKVDVEGGEEIEENHLKAYRS